MPALYRGQTKVTKDGKIALPDELLLVSKFSILFRMNKSSLGMARIDEAIPWDDCPYAKSNANTFVHAHAYRVFRTRVSGWTPWWDNSIRARLPQVLLHYFAV